MNRPGHTGQAVDHQRLEDKYGNRRFDNQQMVRPSDYPQRDDERRSTGRWMPDVEQDHESTGRGQGKCRIKHQTRANRYG